MATNLDTFMPYDAGPGSNVSEDGWRQFAKHWRGDGVIRTGTSGISNSEFAVFGDSTGMQVKVPSGECWIQGNWGKNAGTTTLAIAAAHATLGRRDLVVLRNDFVNNRIELDVKTGTPNASPVYPALTKNSSIWEIQVGLVVVGAAVVTITAGNVQALQTFVDGAASLTVDTGYQVIANNTDTRVDFDLPQFQSSEIDRNGINKFILKRGGFWLIKIGVAWASSTTGYRAVWLARTTDVSNANRLAMNIVNAPNALTCVIQGTAVERFAANEEVAVWCSQGSGGNLQIIDNFGGTRVDFFWLGP